MIKTLRRKFILIAMLSIALVLFLLIGCINISNYMNIGQSVSRRLETIAANNGEFPGPEASREPKKDFGGAEAPFDTRYFTVAFDENGDIAFVNTGKISATNEAAASSYAKKLYDKNKSLGYINNYRYKLFKITDDNGNDLALYVFVDCERELNTFKNFALASLGVGLCGLLLVFILVYIFSGIIMKPVAESYEKQKRFVTDASHELKTPLTIIDANTEVIEMTLGENEWTVSTRKQVQRLASLTEKLVFLSKMDEENVKLDMFDFSLSNTLIDIVENYNSLAKTSGKNLNTQITEGILYHGDEKNIRQLISLLMDNAIKYSSENGTIDVSLELNGKNKILTVANPVDEITPGRHDEFFERFYRTDASHNSKTGGFGIGLSVAAAIVNSHKGRIYAKSDDNHSIKFTVIL